MPCFVVRVLKEYISQDLVHMKFVVNVMDLHETFDSHAPHRCGLNIQTYIFRGSSHT